MVYLRLEQRILLSKTLHLFEVLVVVDNRLGNVVGVDDLVGCLADHSGALIAQITAAAIPGLAFLLFLAALIIIGF